MIEKDPYLCIILSLESDIRRRIIGSHPLKKETLINPTKYIYIYKNFRKKKTPHTHWPFFCHFFTTNQHYKPTSLYYTFFCIATAPPPFISFYS